MCNVFPNISPEQVTIGNIYMVQTDHLSKCFKIERAFTKV